MVEDRIVAIGDDTEIETVFLQETQSSQRIEAFEKCYEKFNTLMMMYGCAIREVKTKLEVLNEEFQTRKSHNPIQSIKYRVKKPDSIVEKLERRGFPVTVDSIYKNLHDVAGVRVVCGYVQDIYQIADLLTSQSDITLLQTKDYIKNPKENGYRSLHLVVEVPVFFSDRCKPMRVEVQIRTIAMDFWASLEHQLKYKNHGGVPENMVEELKSCADVISNTDMRMQSLYNSIQPDNPVDNMKKYNWFEF